MTHLFRSSLGRIPGSWTARHKDAARTRYLDAHALTELGFPPAQQRFHLREWLSSKA